MYTQFTLDAVQEIYVLSAQPTRKNTQHVVVRMPFMQGPPTQTTTSTPTTNGILRNLNRRRCYSHYNCLFVESLLQLQFQ